MTNTNLKAKFETTKNDYPTPQSLFDRLHQEFKFDIDLAASASNTKLPNFFSEAQDALQQDWTGTCFLNPPCSFPGFKWEKWMEKAFLSASEAGTTIVTVIPARTNVGWFHKFCMKSAELRFIQGRLTFPGLKWSLPQPMVVVIFRGCPADPKVTSMKV